MKLSSRSTLHTTEFEREILKLTAERNGISENDVMRHLIIYQGLCGGSFPLTTQILALPPAKRRAVEEKIFQRLKANEELKPQSFKQWLQESLGKIDPEAERRGADAFIKELLD